VGQIHEAITAVNADSVIVLPNNGNVRLAAEKAAAESTKDVRVIPTETIPEGLEAAIAFNPATDVDANEQAMIDAISDLSTAEITRASRDTSIDGIAVREGSWLGLVDGTAVVSDEDLLSVLDLVVDRIVAGERSLVMVLRGDGAPDAELIADHVRRRHPELDDIDVKDGGQPHYPLLLSAV
jgi:hypothetical protein